MSALTVDSLAVPSVSWDDLLAFHAQHFPSSLAPASLQIKQPEPYISEEDDDLGRYPDGIQRTLTDEQIAMFRHSEIQTLLRERRHREEAAADEQEDEEVLETSNPRAHRLEPSNREEDQRPSRSRKGKKQKKSQRPMTQRRHAREQDEIAQENIQLEY